ncbi:MAG: Cof-type HAD-IIB family hydrolase [Anaerolineae bacterium]|nr:Cof-type HAD-IIB family hydrolase [Anaerolineae bacterium]
MLYRGLLSDYDGTVSSIHNTISENVTQALRLLHLREIPFGFCTGRAYSFLEPYIKAQRLNGVHIVCAGAQMVDSEGNILREVLLPEKIMRDVACQIESLHGSLVIKKGGLYGNALAIEDAANRPALNVRPLHELPDWNVPAFYISHLSEEGWGQLEARTDIGLTKQRGRHEKQGFFADGVAPGVNKGSGTRWWCEYHRLDPLTVIGIGDGENDVALFEAVGLGVAVDNAVPELKERAAAIAPSIDEDGVAWTIQRYFQHG